MLFCRCQRCIHLENPQKSGVIEMDMHGKCCQKTSHVLFHFSTEIEKCIENTAVVAHVSNLSCSKRIEKVYNCTELRINSNYVTIGKFKCTLNAGDVAFSSMQINKQTENNLLRSLHMFGAFFARTTLFRQSLS